MLIEQRKLLQVSEFGDPRNKPSRMLAPVPHPAPTISRTLGGLTLHDFCSAQSPPHTQPCWCDHYLHTPRLAPPCLPLPSNPAGLPNALGPTSGPMPLKWPLPGAPFSQLVQCSSWAHLNAPSSERLLLITPVKVSPSLFPILLSRILIGS